jgi:hypothetical protein
LIAIAEDERNVYLLHFGENKKSFQCKSSAKSAKKISFDFSPPRLFLPKFFLMEMQKKNKGLYWILFFISTAILILTIATNWPWLTLVMPFVFTFFVLAMDII